MVVPIWDESKKVTGIIDVLNKRAYEMQDLKRVEIDIPEGKDAVIEEFNNALKESVAETSEEFMDKFFGGEDFTYAEMIHGLRQGVRELSLFPVLCGSAVNCMGSLMLLDNIVDLLPNPMEGNYHKATLPDGETEPFVVSPGGVPTAFVFKTVSDQYGKYSFVKVLSGTLTLSQSARFLNQGTLALKPNARLTARDYAVIINDGTFRNDDAQMQLEQAGNFVNQNIVSGQQSRERIKEQQQHH